MQVDAHEISAGAVLQTDVCIVGGGVAGLCLAREFVGTRVRVCVLESGGSEPEPAVQDLSAGGDDGYPYYPLANARARVLAGSSTRWHVPIANSDSVGARMRPLDPIDFEQRSWVPYSGWPFDKRHLAPFYERADAVCRIEPSSYHVDIWNNGKRPLLHDGTVQTIIYKLALRDRFAREIPAEVTGADNITTYLYATVLEIEGHESAEHVTRLRVSTLRGNEFFVTAKMFVLANGGIEVPRLLLLSNRYHAAGLGNERDLVGRFFMEHLHFWSGILVPDRPKAIEPSGLYDGFRPVNGVAVVGKLALTEQVLRRENLLNQNVQLAPAFELNPFTYPRVDPKAVASLKRVLRGRERISYRTLRDIFVGREDVVRFAFRRTRRIVSRTAIASVPKVPVYIFANMTEQAPNPESRVTLGTDVDAFGQRRVRLDWKISPQDIRSVVRTQEIMGCALKRSGVGRLYRELLDDIPPSTTHGGYHHMGTTRMHDDPRQGVVNRDSRVHGIDNLYIAGPSVFPTGGYANPSLTTVALSLRLADHLKARIGQGRA
jgi:choline dehydrogenase-like flavoprotein